MTIIIPGGSPSAGGAESGGLTRLQLVQRLMQEAPISGTLTTTLSQVGEAKQAVDWIDSAYEDIQNLHPDWDFLRTDLAFNTLPGIDNYPRTSIDADEYGEWIQDSFRCYLTSVGVNGERELIWLPWADFRASYMIGSTRTTTGQPLYVSQQPDTSLILWPIPDAEYTIDGEYFKRAQTMTANADTPLIPSKYRMIIVWRALMFYAGNAPAPEKYAVGQKEYKRLLNALERSQLPAMQHGDALV